MGVMNASVWGWLIKTFYVINTVDGMVSLRAFRMRGKDVCSAGVQCRMIYKIYLINMIYSIYTLYQFHKIYMIYKIYKT